MDDRAWELLTTGEPTPLVQRGATDWIRLRLARDLHERFYYRIGLQAFPVEYGPGAGTLVLASPFCKSAPRFLGKLADGGVATDSSYAPELLPHLTGGHLALESEQWSSWSELLSATVEVLGLAHAQGSSHRGCHHRSSKAFYPTMFDLAVELASRPGGTWRPEVSFEWVRPGTHADSFASKIAGSDQNRERHLAIYTEDWRGVLLRNDGFVRSWEGKTFDAAAAWCAGASRQDLVSAILPLIGLEDGPA